MRKTKGQQFAFLHHTSHIVHLTSTIQHLAFIAKETLPF